MNDETLDTAMPADGRQGYKAQALGHFRACLKAASRSHADSLTVISRTKRSPSVGHRWLTACAKADFTCAIVGPEENPIATQFHGPRCEAAPLCPVMSSGPIPSGFVPGAAINPAKAVMATALFRP
ncbi:hypothetical protein ACIPJG_00835 [Streptomyces halstedii]|uniref:hypothetical protein n=1 Tax=Streptomyces TaxID=1883 RepID=UPI00081D7450|nr:MULTISPECIES: hypothetical protein [Streptomyces]SCE32212.1 hypothetical protein GA0115249_117726 [Streptomyces sp. PpalLS-921]